MFDRKSRYYATETATLEVDGRTITYARRRILPDPATIAQRMVLKLDPGERLDLIAHRTLGNSLLFWRVCDATGVLDPLALVDEEGARVVVPAVTG